MHTPSPRQSPLATLALTATLCALAAPAQAADGARAGVNASDSSLRLRVEALTDAPLHVGVGALAELPFRLRVATSLGFLPAGYVRLSNSVVQAFDDSYTDATAQLVEDALQSSLVWRVQAGWRPWGARGWYAHVNYSRVMLGGQSTGAELVAGLTGSDLPDRQSTDGAFEVLASSTLQMLGLELGYEWAFGVDKHLTLRTALGWSYTFTSATTVEAQFTARREQTRQAIAALEQEAAAYLDDTYQRYIHPPTLTVAVGWAF